MTSRIALAGSFILALSSSVGHAAPSAGSTKVGLQPSRASDGLPQDWVGSLEDKMIEGLGRGDFEVERADGADARCDKPTCRSQISRQVGAAYLAQLGVDKIESDYDLTIDLFSADGQRLVLVEGICDTCGIAEVEAKVADLAALVKGKLDALRRGRPKLRFVSTPKGAALSIDGTLVGTTPLVTETDAGVHRVKVEQKGYVALEREVTAVSGTQETVTLDLQPVPRSQRFLPWGIGSLVVGTAAAVTGAVLIVFHERPFQDCTGSNVDADGDCRLVYDTLIAGATLTAVGGAGIVTGAVLLGVGRRDKKKSRRIRANAGGITVQF